jgi:hypothetical protein
MSTAKGVVVGIIIGAALVRPKEALSLVSAVVTALNDPRLRVAVLANPRFKEYIDSVPGLREQLLADIARMGIGTGEESDGESKDADDAP